MRVGVEAFNDLDEAGLHTISVQGGGDCLWVDLVKRLLPVKEEEEEWILDCFSLFHKSSDNVDRL